MHGYFVGVIDIRSDKGGVSSCCHGNTVVASLGFVYLQPVPLADIEQMSLVTVTQDDELSRCVRIYLPTSDERVIKVFVPIHSSFSVPVIAEVCS